jgi:hypothetical protein
MPHGAARQEGRMRNATTEFAYQPSQLRETPGKPGPHHKQMEMFLGSWKAEGTAGTESPSPGRMRTEDHYAWYDGGHYLIDHGLLQVNDDPAAPHIWVMGYDEPNECYFVQAFDSVGDYRLYRVTLQGRTWSYTGEWERAQVTFDADGNGYRAIWEQTKDGTTWHNLCDVRGTKLK